MGKRVITRDDVIRAGACASGVDDWILRQANPQTAMPPALALRACKTRGEREWVLLAAEIDGFGFGFGYGDGYGGDGGDGGGHGGYGNYGPDDGVSLE
jgi:hypothetical protein